MKTPFFWVALSLIGISWTLNSFYAHSKHLDEPIFLNHYIETTMQENTYLTFYYLTNKNDTSHVSFVNMDTVGGYIVGDHFFYTPNRLDLNEQTFTHHVLRSIRVEFNSSDIETAVRDGDFSFDEMDVFFTDGREMTVPIGQVIVHPSVPDETILTQWGSVSGAWDEFLYEATEPLIIDKINYSFEDMLQNQIAIKINTSKGYPNEEKTIEALHNKGISEWKEIPGINLQDVEFPIELKERDIFEVYIQVDPQFKGYLEPNLILSGASQSGVTFTTHSGFNYRPYLDQKDVNEIIQEKAKGDIHE